MKKPKPVTAKGQAFEWLRTLERPPSISRTQWRGVLALLYAIARHYPKAYPGQDRLAQKMDLSVRTVQNYVYLARDAGLLTVVPQAGVGGRFKTNQYLLNVVTPPDANIASGPYANIASKSSDTAYQNLQEAPTVLKTSSSAPTLRGGCAAAKLYLVENSQSRGGNRTPEEIVAPFGTRRIPSRRKSSRDDPSPARRLTSYFVDRWFTEVAERSDRYAKVRTMDGLGQSTGYFRTVFLQPKDGRTWTEDEVRSMIDDFMHAVLTGQARIKTGQSAFMCFTGWWGRRPVAQYDPDAYRKYFEERR